MGAPRFEAYYYGCLGRPGHFMFGPDGRTDREFYRANPWGQSVDTGLCPPGDVVDGRALVHHKGGWTALSFWDRTIDSRPGSHSTFLALGTLDFAAVVEVARREFPIVWARLPFEVIEAGRA